MKQSDATLSSDHLNDQLKTTIPDSLALEKWADTDFNWSGKIPVTAFERLSVLSDGSQLPEPLLINAHFYRQNHVLHLVFKVTGAVWLTCQRCLNPVAVDLTDDYDLALLDDEAQIQLIDEDQDYLVLNEVIEQSHHEQLLPFKTLIEDEMLLKLPLAPKHDDCEMAVEQVGDIPEIEQENPFAALAALKGKL